MRKFSFPTFAFLLLAFSTARAETAPIAAAPAAQEQEIMTRLGGEPFVYEIIRHLYRWYLTEADINRHIGDSTLTLWLRPLQPKLDPGDKSEFAEIVLPVMQVRITLKKTDYHIDELNLDVKSNGYRIQSITQEPPPSTADGYVVKEINLPLLIDYLFKSRNQREYPDPKLAERLRKAVLAGLGDLKIAPIDGVHICHVGPLSPVSNELWVFWENARMLVRFTSDLDLSNPAVWGQENLKIRMYNVDTQVVVSLSETPGSNAFLTREQVGRVLYNCIVMGKRVTLPGTIPATMGPAAPSAPATAPVPAAPAH